MEKTYLIAGKEYPFCEGFANYIVNNGDKIMVTLLDSKEKSTIATPSFMWNRASPISARSLILETETNLGSIDTAFLMFDTSLYVNDFDKMGVEIVSRGLDTLFAGYMYLTLELVARHLKKNGGNICFILKTHPSLVEAVKHQKRTEIPPSGPIVEAAAAAFRSFAENIATKYAGAPIGIQLIECAGTDDDAKTLCPWLIPYIESVSAKPIVDAKIASKWVQLGAKAPSGWQLFKR